MQQLTHALRIARRRRGGLSLALLALGAGTAGEANGLIQIRVVPARMPTADAPKPNLFPGSFANTSDDQPMRIVTREAFPGLVGLTKTTPRESDPRGASPG